MPLEASGSSVRNIYRAWLRDTLLHRRAAALFQFFSRPLQHPVTIRANVVTVTIVSARVLHAKVQPREVSTTAFVVCRCCNVPGPLAETLVLVVGKLNEALCAHCCFLQAAAAGSRVKWR